MKAVKVAAAAKLNLTFDITGLRPDGYHDVETIFQSIDLADTLKFEVQKSDSTAVSITCQTPGATVNLPLDDGNLIARASRAFLDAAGLTNYAIGVELEKLIPIGAGLAGGSADAAATLVALNTIFEGPLSAVELEAVASALGSDIPFCLRGGTCVGRGRGELLQPVDTRIDFTVCIVKPRDLSVPTPWAYAAFDEYEGAIIRPDLAAALGGLESGDLEQTLSGFGNVFEPVVFSKHPELRTLKQRLIALGAWCCHLTGSGPTLFAVVAGREAGHHLRRHLLNDDELGFSYGTGEAMIEGRPFIDFRIAQSCRYGVKIESIVVPDC